MKLYDNIIVFNNQTVRDVFRVIDGLSLKIVFLLDSDNRLLGVISDGDIRRFILNGGDLDGSASEVITKDPISVVNIKDAERILEDRPNLKAIPIVDNSGFLQDIYCRLNPICLPLNIPVVINAGGRGKRLDPYTTILPKPLIPVWGFPVIELIMKEFEKYKCEDFFIIVNYKGQMIKAYFSEAPKEYSIKWKDEKEPLGTGGGVRLVKEDISETFFLMNCDTLIKTDYACVYEQHRKENNVVTVVCAYKNIQIPYGVVETSEGGRIEDIKEKPEISFLANTGMYVIEPKVLDEIGENECVGFTEVLDRVMKKGMKVGVYPISEKEWLDMGQPDELERMKKILGDEMRTTL